MTDFLIHLIEANVLLLLLLAVYWLVRGQLAFGARRLVLLAIPVLSGLVFALRFMPEMNDMAVYRLPVFEIGSAAGQLPDKMIVGRFAINPEEMYWLGVMIFFLLTAYRIFRILRRMHLTEGQWISGSRVVHMSNESCFSFLHHIQIDPELDREEQEIIFEHELMHVRKGHSYDLLFIRLVQVFNWFNPGLLILRKELQQVHEYQVDRDMYLRHRAGYMEFLLSYSLGGKTRRPALTNPFYSSQTLIKRMNVMRTQQKNRWAVALALPAVAGIFALMSWTFQNTGEHRSELFVPLHDKVVQDSQTLPEFPGGNEAMANYLVKNLAYPDQARKDRIEGTVFVGFVITKTGSITNCAIRKGISAELDAEALRVVCGMPDWIPATKASEPVNAEMTIPINFKL